MSIHEQAVEVSLVINMPQMSKTDREAVAELAIQHGADPKSLNMTKELYPAEMLAPINTIKSQARHWHREGAGGTYPWRVSCRLLPSTRIMDFLPRCGEIELAFDQAVTAFLNNWANVMRDAQDQLGDLHEANLYPAVEALRAQFKLKFKIDPVTTTDWRIQVNQEAMDALEARTAQQTAERFADLAAFPVEKLRGEIDHLMDILNKPMRTNSAGEEAVPIFRDSSVQNVIDAAAQMIDFGPDVIGPAACALAQRVIQNVPSPERIRLSPDSWEECRLQVRNLSTLVQGDPNLLLDVPLVDEDEDEEPALPAHLLDPDTVNPMGLEAAQGQATLHRLLQSPEEFGVPAGGLSVAQPVDDDDDDDDLPSPFEFAGGPDIDDDDDDDEPETISPPDTSAEHDLSDLSAELGDLFAND